LYRAAFFISPSGNIVEIMRSHIAFVIENPELFGLTKDKIIVIYREYDEPVGLEGQAREEILIQIIQKGWIRIRRYKEYWRVTLDSLTAEKEMYLKKWAKYITDNKYTPVKILDLSLNKEYRYKLNDFLTGSVIFQ